MSSGIELLLMANSQQTSFITRQLVIKRGNQIKMKVFVSVNVVPHLLVTEYSSVKFSLRDVLKECTSGDHKFEE